METDKKILKILLKDLAIKPTISSLAGDIGMSRVGLWKVLKKMESKKIISLSPIGSGKTSTYTIGLNWDNALTGKTLAVALTEDALKNQRWASNFSELENKVDFLIIYGSILHSIKEAKDIDILAIANKNKFLEIEEIIRKIQKTQNKKIHYLIFTNSEFIHEIEIPNKSFIDALKKGVVLFGQEKFIKFMKNVKR